MKKTVFLLFFALIISSIAITNEHTGNLIVIVYSEEYQSNLPGATVTIKSLKFGNHKKKDTNACGRAAFRNLPIDKYNIIVEMDGFKTSNTTYVKLSQKKTTKIEILLIAYEIPTNILDYDIISCTPLIDTTLNTIEYQHYGEISDFLNYIDHQPIDKKYNAKNTLRPGNCIIKNDHGDILVVVLSDENEPVENANITIRSNSLMGIRSEYTGVDGRAAVLNLPPGIYVVETYKSGFNLLIDTDISIGEGRNAYLIEKLSINKDFKVYSRRCVEGLPPMIDVTRSSLIHEYDMNTVRHLP